MMLLVLMWARGDCENAGMQVQVQDMKQVESKILRNVMQSMFVYAGNCHNHWEDAYWLLRDNERKKNERDSNAGFRVVSIS